MRDHITITKIYIVNFTFDKNEYISMINIVKIS